MKGMTEGDINDLGISADQKRVQKLALEGLGNINFKTPVPMSVTPAMYKAEKQGKGNGS